MRVAVLADTHLRATSRRRLPAACLDVLAGADAILHAGDVIDAEVLDQLRAVAPLHAVLGNNDTGLVGVLPETVLVELGGVRIGMIHDSGPRAGRPARLRRRFPDAAVVVFGHSHIPWDELWPAPPPLHRLPRRPPPHDPPPSGGDGLDGPRLFNPGSPTDKRMQPHPTMGLLQLDGGAVVGHEILRVD